MNNGAKSEFVRDIVIYKLTSEQGSYLRCVLLEHGLPVELLETELSDNECLEPICGRHSWCEQDIILAEVKRVVPSLAAAFVDLGGKKEGMLPLKLASAEIKAGQTAVVQIRRITTENKGDQLTAKPQIPGFFAVYRPFESRSLKRSKLSYLPAADRDAVFQTELEALQELWSKIQQEASAGGALPKILARFQEPLVQALRDWTGTGLRQIHVEGAELFAEADRILANHAPLWRKKLRLMPEKDNCTPQEIFRLSDLDKQISSRIRLLKNGGSIVIDQTEALLAIDVNSAKADRKRDPQKLWLETNMLAAEEAARLLRLRRIHGLVVIDFIRLRSQNDREELAAYFEMQLSKDRARIKIGGFTKLGLFELTRSMKKM